MIAATARRHMRATRVSSIPIPYHNRPMVTPMNIVFLIVLPLLFAVADRGIGGALRRSIVIGAALAVAIGLGLAGYGFLAILVAIWATYRTIPWQIGGSTTPRGPGQIAGALVRHALPAVAVVGGNVWFATPWTAAIPLLAYAVATTAMAVSYAGHVDELIETGGADNGGYNDKLEIARGAAFGLAAAATQFM